MERLNKNILFENRNYQYTLQTVITVTYMDQILVPLAGGGRCVGVVLIGGDVVEMLTLLEVLL